jgi:hypothetical protein
MYSLLETDQDRRNYVLGNHLQQHPPIPHPMPAYLDRVHVRQYNALATREEQQAYVAANGLDQAPPTVPRTPTHLLPVHIERFAQLQTLSEKLRYMESHRLQQPPPAATTWLFYRDSSAEKLYLIRTGSDEAKAYQRSWSDDDKHAYFVAHAHEVRDMHANSVTSPERDRTRRHG